MNLRVKIVIAATLVTVVAGTLATFAVAGAGGAPMVPKSLHVRAVRHTDRRVASTKPCFTFAMQRDGNAVEYGPRHSVVWSTNTYGHPGARLVVQRDGNIVVYAKNNVALWASNTYGHRGARLVLQSDGNTVLYAPNNKALWSRGTTQGCAFKPHTGTDSPRAEAAIRWMEQHSGTTSLDGYCERAVALAFARIDHPALPDAHADWSRFAEHHLDPNPPRGALVFWRTSAHWHIGISLGHGGVISTSSQQYGAAYGRGIGVSSVLGYYPAYQGWTPNGL